ncbi:MAG: hypothetical protein KBD46_00570 [Candidatus Levybacteria bacterium]|nr:hypothetical protein [Candidatus Levybacteria bacterium]
MLYFWIFAIELLFLFFLSHEVTKACSRVFSLYLLAFLFFPGTLLHELAHYFMALILFVPVGHMEFIPKVHGTSVKLGSVMIGKTDPFRRALIGLAPLFGGLVCLLGAIYYFSSFPLQIWILNILLLLFIVFEISNTMFSSRRDVEGIPALLAVISIFVISAWILDIRIPEPIVTYVSSITFQTFFQQLSLYLLIPLGLDGGILLFSRLMESRQR